MTKVTVNIKRRKNKVSKRIGLVVVLAMVLVLATASLVFAAQSLQFNGSNNGQNDFAATPKTFNADGNSNYPNEIYIPNEQNTGDYRIHSNYTATTDACASCHSTHTAVGEALLQWGTVYDTCMACHDGTVTTTYNVEEGKIGTTNMPTSGGLFGHSSDPSLSNHNVSGSINVYAAPGGPSGTGAAPTGSWDSEFSCQSCHSPHGQGGNARALNPDVNGLATANYTSGKTKGITLISDGGNKYHSDWNNDGVNDTWLYSGHGYSDKVAVYDKDGNKLASTAYTLSNATGSTVITIVSGTGNGPFKADFIASIKVAMNITNYLKANEKVQDVAGLNDFCSACHVDYNTTNVKSSATTLSGTYTEAYRHQVGFDRTKSLTQMNKLNMKLEATPNGKNNVTCETCHVAHGTNQTYWQETLVNRDADGNVVLDASGNTTQLFQAKDLVEVAGSSALKRIPNMGTCEACHAKGAASEGYAANNGSAVIPTTNVTSNSEGGGYVGQAACVDCHKDMSEHYNETWHPDISRPGLPKKVADEAATQSDASLDSIVPGFAQAIRDTQAEITKVGYDAKGRLDLDAADWAGKGVVANNVKVWSTGTDTGSEIMVRGSVLIADGETVIGTANVLPDKWYIVAVLDNGKIVSTNTEPEDYGCGTRGCHTTGYTINSRLKTTGASSDFTVWLNAAAAGTKVPFELGVTCEACHGQGGNHVKAPSAKNIVNPVKSPLRVQTVGQQDDGQGNFTKFNSAKAFLDYVGGVGNAKACGACHNGGHHQGDFYTNTADGSPSSEDPHFSATTTKASCITCHDSHKESADPRQMAKGTIAQTCQQCHGSMGSKNPDGTYKGLTFEPGSTDRILHTFPN